jgi:hypothetical protein
MNPILVKEIRTDHEGEDYETNEEKTFHSDKGE